MNAFFITVLVTQFKSDIHVYIMDKLEWMQVSFFKTLESNGLIVFVQVKGKLEILPIKRKTFLQSFPKVN